MTFLRTMTVLLLVGAAAPAWGSLSEGEQQLRSALPKDGPDVEALGQIKLPMFASRGDVAAYIRAILFVSENQKRHLPADPQVAKLAAVGHDHLPELLGAANGSYPWNVYLVEAIGIVASDADKVAIIKHAEGFPDLIDVIVLKGWIPDARAMLVEKLRRTKGYLPTAWVRAVASLDDPATHDALVAYFLDGWNRHATYDAIRAVPNLDLSKVLPQAWENARAAGAASNYEVAYLLPAVLAAGYRPALDFAFESLDDNAGVSKGIVDVRALVLRYTGATGTNAELHRWYAARHRSLSFDRKLVRFVARPR